MCVPPGGATASTDLQVPAHWAPLPPSAGTWGAPSPCVWFAGHTASSGRRTSSTGRCWARAASARPSRYRACRAWTGQEWEQGGRRVQPISPPSSPQCLQEATWKGLPDSQASLLHLGLRELVRGRVPTPDKPRTLGGGCWEVAAGRAAQPHPEGLILSLMPTHLGSGLLSPSHSPQQRRESFPGSHVTSYDEARGFRIIQKVLVRLPTCPWPDRPWPPALIPGPIARGRVPGKAIIPPPGGSPAEQTAGLRVRRSWTQAQPPPSLPTG